MKNNTSFGVWGVITCSMLLGSFFFGAYVQDRENRAGFARPIVQAFSKPVSNHDNDCEPLGPAHRYHVMGGGQNEHVVINGAMLVPAAPPTMDYCDDDEPSPHLVIKVASERRLQVTPAFMQEQHNMRAATEHGLLTAIEEVRNDIVRCKKAPDYVEILKEELEVLERRLRDLE